MPRPKATKPAPISDDLTVYVDKDLEGSYIAEPYLDGSGWKLTYCGGRQVIASAATAEALVKYGKKRGATRVEIF